MDDGDIAPENPSKQEPNQCDEGTAETQYNITDARRTTQMSQADNSTRREKANRGNLWRTVTETTQESRYQGSGINLIPTYAIRNSRETTERYM
jgi:hypothetical protein